MSRDGVFPAYLGRVLRAGTPIGTCFEVARGTWVTAFHVVAGIGGGAVGDKVEIDPLAGGPPITTTIFAVSPKHDLAVLQGTGSLGGAVPAITPTDAVQISARTDITGVPQVEDDCTYRHLDAPGEWAGATTREVGAENVPLGSVTAGSVVPGMSGAPVRLRDSGNVVGVVSGRYHSGDGWVRDRVWVARTEDLRPLLQGVEGVPFLDASTTPSYRSAKAAPGAFRAPGSFHVHIDGSLAQMERLVPRLSDEDPSFPGKFNVISAFTSGPQRKQNEFRETYQHHTPGTSGEEQFAAFSTTLLGAGETLAPSAVEALSEIIRTVTAEPGGVVELERVVGIFDEHGEWQAAKRELIPTPSGLEELGFQRRCTFPIEIHHSIDIPRKLGQSVPPVTVGDMTPGLDVGGWFLFEKAGKWAYRSSQFADWSDYPLVAEAGRNRVRRFLADKGLLRDATVRTLVEQVLGIWRHAPARQEPEKPQAVPDLARWERSSPANARFWVIAANFLGDKSPDVRNAMKANLAKGVSYTYFVRSYADVLRLGILRDELERELGLLPKIHCVLLENWQPGGGVLASFLRSDYFISPDRTHAGGVRGYELQPRATGGKPMKDADVDALVDALTPILERKVASLYFSPDDRWTPHEQTQTDVCIACTDLVSLADHMGLDKWRMLVTEYDRIFSREVSTFAALGGPTGGPVSALVVRPVRNGYLLVFRGSEAAAEWARRLQLAVRRLECKAKRLSPGAPKLVHNIVLNRGASMRVLRAHGYDYIGPAVDNSIAMLSTFQSRDPDDRPGPQQGVGTIVMSGAFASDYKARVGATEYNIGTASIAQSWDAADPGAMRLLLWPAPTAGAEAVAQSV